MMFFLSKTWPLLLVAALIGALVSWLLCRRRGIAAVAAVGATTSQQPEIDRLRARITELERAQVSEKTPTPAPAPAPAPTTVSDEATVSPEVPVAAGVIAEQPALRTAADLPEPAPAVAVDPPASTEPAPVDTPPISTEPVLVDTPPETTPEAVVVAPIATLAAVEPAAAAAVAADVAAQPELDLAAAATILGRRIKLDDLTAVEGIGPQIAGLCRGIDILTWRDLANTPVEKLQEMLRAAGPRFQVHHPASWPRQAGLLAEGRWADFKTLTDALKGGREVV